MNKQELMNMVSGARGGSPVCRPVRLRSVGQMPRRELAYCPFPAAEPDVLFREFSAAPQFGRIDVHSVLSRSKHGVRAVFVSENGYHASQAALYLAALSSRMDRDPLRGDACEEDDDEELNRELYEMLGIDEEEREMKNALLVASPSLLDPGILSGGEDESPVVAMMAGQKRLDTSSLPAPALLIASESGPVLSSAVVEQLELACDKGRDVFVALKKRQIDLELINELQFRHQFQVLRIGPATDDYLVSVLRSAVSAQRSSLATGVNGADVISRLRRVRGDSFSELDLYDLAAYAAQKTEGTAFTADDLTYQPFRPVEEEKRALDRLNGMTGLDNVKQVLRRQLAVAIFNAKHGKSFVTGRSLAFAGSPGTGKSVTARLVAEILREEGCGTGRFVEAGREQLVGKYVGHTSPKIAKLFEEARGGVLFIDEAGALIPERGDSYAEEAVNALVRHMELEQETVVIFATYSEEMKRLLNSNPGLASRVAKVLEFPDYTDEELWSILGTLTAEANHTLPAEAHDVCCEFFRALREKRGKSFGNGREARRLRDAAIEELALRALEGAEDSELTAADFAAAARCLLEQESSDPSRRRVGF